jgi:ribonuclease HI
MLFFDGSTRNKKAGAGVVLIDPSGEQVKYMVLLDFDATNNMAEYEALIFGLMVALSLGIRELLVKGDSNSSSGKSGGSAVANIPSSTHFKRNNPLVYQVTAQFNHGYTRSR